jgi:hypothetical protein
MAELGTKKDHFRVGEGRVSWAFLLQNYRPLQEVLYSNLEVKVMLNVSDESLLICYGCRLLLSILSIKQNVCGIRHRKGLSRDVLAILFCIVE